MTDNNKEANARSNRNAATSDEERHEQEALRRSQPEGLIGDTAENRNLTGSTTWETLPDNDNNASDSGSSRSNR